MSSFINPPQLTRTASGLVRSNSGSIPLSVPVSGLPQLTRIASGTSTRAPQLTRTASASNLVTSPFEQDSVSQIKISESCDSPVQDWPLNNGCDGTVATPETLPVNTIVDRFGRLNGEFFSPVNEKFISRSLKPIMNRPECKEFYKKKYSKDNKYTATNAIPNDWRLQNDYIMLRVLKPLDVVKCTAAPAFGQPGGATQYWVPKKMTDPFAVKSPILLNGNPNPDGGKPDNYTIQELIDNGFLELLKKEIYNYPDYEGGFTKRKSRRNKKNIRKSKRRRRRSIKGRNK
jgi:hypothetical protein